MKGILLLLLSYLLSSSAFAQLTVANVLKKIRHAHSDTEKIAICAQLVNPLTLKHVDSVETCLEQVFEDFSEKGFQYGQGRIASMIGDLWNTKGQLKLAERKYLLAYDFYKKLASSSEIALVESRLGVIEGKRSNYPNATRYFLSSLRQYEVLHDTSGISDAHLKLGTLYSRCNYDSMAMASYLLALRYAKYHPDTTKLVQIYNNIATMYGKARNYEAALKFLDSSVLLCADERYNELKVMPYTNLGNILEAKGDRANAIKYFQAAYQVAEKSQNPELRGRALFNLAITLEPLQTKQAINLLQEALAIAQQADLRSMQLEIMKELKTKHTAIKEYAHALSLADSLLALKDSLFSSQKAVEMADLQSAYDLERSNEVIKSMEQQKAKDSSKSTLVGATAVLLGFSLFVALLLFQRSQRFNKRLSEREQELKKANDMKDKLFSIIGHDLRTPIASIPLAIEFYRDPETTEEERTFILDALEENGSNSLEILDKLLNWGRLQLKGVAINPMNFKVFDIVENKIRLISITAAKKQIVLVNAVPKDTTVFVDLNHLEFILRNLLSNAIKYSHAGSSVEVNADMTTHSGFTTFSVRDQGVGMDATTMRRIFETYNISKPGTARETGNSIGLLLCKEFVLANGGKIWVESEPGVGSTFFFTVKTSDTA
jgi:signal transduction histidine kinase